MDNLRICSQTKELMEEGFVLLDDFYIKYQSDLDGYLIEWAKDDEYEWDDIEELRDKYFEEGMYYWTIFEE